MQRRYKKAFLWKLAGSMVSIAAALAQPGCASIQSKRLGQPLGADGAASAAPTTPAGLRVSGGERVSQASPQLGVLEFTFENVGTDWLRIDAVELDFGADDRNARVRVPWGEDLATWRRAIAQRNAVKEVNRSLLLGGLALGGAALATASDSRGARAAGGLVTLAATGALAADRVDRAIESAERVAPFPNQHLFSGEFSVPPGLFAKKWVLLNTEGSAGAECLHTAELRYRVDGQREERVRVKFKRRSDWQRAACRRWFGYWFRE